MKNIYKIFRSDLSRLGTNVVAVVVIMGLCVLPSLYAWFNIISNWDPYSQEATSQIKVAVVSVDSGSSIGSLDLNIGDSVIDALKQNNTIGWEYKSSVEEALEGVERGDTYAALIIPEDFSTKLLSFINGSPEHPQIDYYENEKKNAIAPKITGKAQTAVSRQINEVFVEEVTGVISQISQVAYGIVPEDVFGSLSSEISIIRNDMNVYVELLNSFNGALDSAGSMLGSVQGLIPYMQNTVEQAKNTISGIETIFSDDEVEIKNYLISVQTTLDEINNNLVDIEGSLQSSRNYLIDGGSEIEGAKTQLKQLQDDLTKIISKINSIADIENYDSIVEIINNEGEAISSFIASPVKINTVQVYSVENYGSTAAPFYSILAIWVGALILVVIIHIKVQPDEKITNVKHYHEFFGRYCIFFMLGQVQTLIIVLGDLFYLRIQCLNPFLFWLAAAIASLTFTLFIYAITYAFGNIGEAIVLIILVIQVAGAGGTYPIEILPEFYQSLYRFMPFSYCMNALRETIAGMHNMDYWKYISFMFICIAISLVLGLVVAKPFKGLNNIIEKCKNKSSLIK